MKLIDTINRAGRSLREAKIRTLLTSLAIAVGAFTIVLSLAAGAGGRQYAEDIVTANTNIRQIQVTQKQDESTVDYSQPQEYSEDPTVSLGDGFTFKQLTQVDIDKIAAIDGIESVEPAYNVAIKYITTEGAKDFQGAVDAFDPDIAIEYEAGSGDNLAKNEVVLPTSFVDVLGFSSAQDAIGKTIDVVVTKGSSTYDSLEEKSFSYVVKGVSGTNALSFASAGNLLITNDALKDLYTYNTEGTENFGVYMYAYAIAKEGADATELRDQIDALGYEALSAEDLLTTIFQFINVLQTILLGFGGLAILTSVFGIINTQYISVLERTQQIGLMKALGMRRRDVGRLFKLEAAWIGFLGGAIGGGIAVIAGSIANPYIADYLKLGDGTNLLIFQPLAVLGVVAGLMLIAVVAGILPARKASKLDPIEALRTE